MRRNFLFLVVLVFGAVTACNKPSLEGKDSKVIYAVGFDMGSKTKALNLTSDELKVLAMGFHEGASGGSPKVDLRAQISQVGRFFGERQKSLAQKESKKSEAFLKKAEAMKGAQKMDSGLIYLEKTPGTGPSPKKEDSVKVHYHGTLEDGSSFDSSKEGPPVVFSLMGVIPCWTEGIQKMKVGGKSELYCPSILAYGNRGSGEKIPPGAALKFEVELFEIIPPKKSKKGKKRK